MWEPSPLLLKRCKFAKIISCMAPGCFPNAPILIGREVLVQVTSKAEFPLLRGSLEPNSSKYCNRRFVISGRWFIQQSQEQKENPQGCFQGSKSQAHPHGAWRLQPCVACSRLWEEVAPLLQNEKQLRQRYVFPGLFNFHINCSLGHPRTPWTTKEGHKLNYWFSFRNHHLREPPLLQQMLWSSHIHSQKGVGSKTIHPDGLSFNSLLAPQLQLA